MKHLKVAEARAQFGEMLDRAEQGLPVVIERRGVRFRLVAESGGTRASAARPLFDHVDDAVMSGRWTWKPERTGLTFGGRRKTR